MEDDSVFLYCKGAVAMACLWGTFVSEVETLPVFKAWLQAMTDKAVVKELAGKGIDLDVSQEQITWTIQILDRILLPALNEMENIGVV